jgi:hypothetical protein
VKFVTILLLAKVLTDTPLCLVQLVLTSLAAVATPLGWRHEERLGIPEYI